MYIYISKLQSNAAPCQSLDLVLQEFDANGGAFGKCAFSHPHHPPLTPPKFFRL